MTRCCAKATQLTPSGEGLSFVGYSLTITSAKTHLSDFKIFWQIRPGASIVSVTFSQGFSQKSAESKSPEKYFFIIRCDKDV